MSETKEQAIEAAGLIARIFAPLADRGLITTSDPFYDLMVKSSREIEKALQAAREEGRREERERVKEWAKARNIQFGCDGKHRGPCGEGLHHHHDQFCQAPWDVLEESK